MTPARKLKEFQNANPRLFKICDSFFDGELRWSEYCFLPIAAGIAVTTNGKLNLDFTDEIVNNSLHKAIELVCLYTWRITKGVYRFHPEIYEELRQTKLEKIPSEVFFRLPEWCIFIELQGPEKEKGIEGFWSWTEHDVNTDKFELRFLFLFKDGETFSLPILLDKETLINSFIHLLGELFNNPDLDFVTLASMIEAKQSGHSDEINHILKSLDLYVQLVAYLCSDEADLPQIPPKPQKPIIKSNAAHSFREPPSPAFWAVGERIGAAIRKYKESRQQFSEGGRVGVRTPKRPHIRRAHWHRYRTGKGRQQISVKWLHPIFVNVEMDEEELPVTVRNVIK